MHRKCRNASDGSTGSNGFSNNGPHAGCEPVRDLVGYCERDQVLNSDRHTHLHTTDPLYAQIPYLWIHLPAKMYF